MQIHGVMAMVMVQDIERSLRFYRDTLGFTVEDEQEDWVQFAEGVSLGLAPEPLPEASVALNAVIVTLIVADVTASYHELIAKGVAFFLPPTADGGLTFATFRDTEGNLLQLMQT